MTTPTLLFTRPGDEIARGAEAARRAGFAILAAPLLQVEPLDFAVPPGPFDALLFTSPRAPAVVAAVAPALRAWPVLCVGPRTAEAAARAGFRVDIAGETDGAAIVRDGAARGFRRLLQPCGENRIGIPLPAGVYIEPVPVYRASAVGALPTDASAALAGGQLFATMLFSPRTARIFAGLVDGCGLERGRIRLVALSANVADAAGPEWRATATARLPNLHEAMAAAARMWQDRADD